MKHDAFAQANGGNRRPAGKGRGTGAALFCLALVLAAAPFPSCSRAPAPVAIPTAPLDPAAVREALDRWEAPPVLQGRGLVRLWVEDRSLPSLNARFVVQEAGGGLLSLRPGMLSPVLDLWFGPEEWTLFLPRMKVFAHGGGGGEDSLRPAIGKLGAYLLLPLTLAREMREAETTARDAALIFRGRSPVSEGGARLAEIWLDGGSLAVSRWSLSSSSGESIVRVAYDPPMDAGEYRGRIDFLLPGLGVRGSLEVRELKPGQWVPGSSPAPKEDWEEIEPEEIPDLLQGVVETEGNGL